ncbi:MAG: integrase [Azospirillum brasilense]|nr:MAG: integrase [Azospirillum brasilense]
MAGKLSPAGVRSLVKVGRHGDGRGLHLYVQSPQRRTWVLRYMRDGKSRDMGLGAYPDVSLAEAREKAEAARRLIRDGIDPLQARRAAEAQSAEARGCTFRLAAEALMADKGGGWRNEAHRAQWKSTLESYAYPKLGDTPVQEIDTAVVLEVLRPLWTRVPETASRVRGRIEAVLDAAKARGWREGENPARWRGHLATMLPAPRKVKAAEHHPSLPWQQMPAFMAALRGREGVSARAVELVILTAARSGEVRGMTWSEVDLGEAIWTVPARRMKAGKAHRVPLSKAAAALLRSQRPVDVIANALVFPGAKRISEPLSDMSLTAVLRRMNGAEPGRPIPWQDALQGEPITVHGFRSSFRVWAGEETHYPREIVEAALAHTLKDKVEAAYARTDLLERRRPLMEDWAQWCEGMNQTSAAATPT